MKRKRHNPEQIVGHLRDAEAMVSEGKTVAQVCKKLGVSEQTYHRWKHRWQAPPTPFRIAAYIGCNSGHWPCRDL